MPSRLTAVAVIAVAVAAPLTAWVVVDGLRATAEAGGQAATAIVRGIADLFTPEERLAAAGRLREAVARSGDELLVATVQREVTVDATSDDYLGGTRVRVTAPATAQLLVRLVRWEVAFAGGTLFVRRPGLLVVNPVAVDVGAWRWERQEALLHVGRDERLRRTIEQALLQEAWADAVRDREQARPQADQAVEAFVRAWLLPRTGAAAQVERVVLVDVLPPCPGGVVVIQAR